jgi:hypothetical protein
LLLWVAQLHFQPASFGFACLDVLGGWLTLAFFDAVCAGNNPVIVQQFSPLRCHVVLLLKQLSLGGHLINVGELKLVVLFSADARSEALDHVDRVGKRVLTHH